MNKLLALLAVLRKGEEVADPAAWKARQIGANALAAVLVALAGLARAFDIPVEVSDADALAVAAGVLALWNVVLTAATSRKVGLLPERPADPGPPAAG